ncbi:Hypothetical predicted protein, partial [Paramuricea clavata]
MEELKVMWNGVHLVSSLSGIPLIFKAALLYTSSDIPASRKLSGFKGHSSGGFCENKITWGLTKKTGQN